MNDQTKLQHKGLYAALAAAQADMGPALKDSTNPAFKSKYADLASVMAACMPALSAHGIAVLQPAFDDESGRYVKTIFVHGESGESVECRVPLIVAKNDMQGYGSAVTYGRRYGLMGMAGIAPEDDDGNAAAKAPPKDEPKQMPAAHQPSQVDVEKAKAILLAANSLDALRGAFMAMPNAVKAHPEVLDAKDVRKVELESAPPANLGGDGIPY
jgi:hypothetical protein